MRNSVAEVIALNIIDRFSNEQLAKGRSELTVKTYRQALEAFERYLIANGGSINALTRRDVQSYISHLEAEGRTASTLNRILAAVSVFAKFLQRSELTQDIRLPKVRPVQQIAPKCLERNELNRLLRDVERKGNTRDTAIVYLLAFTGLRVSELTALNREDVTMTARSGSLVVRNGKGNVSRNVPVPAEARLWLSRYLELRQDSDEALFLSNYGQRINVRSVQHLLANFGTHPHALRHTYCRTLVSKGVDIALVAEVAGHSDINVTRRYSKPTQDELIQAIDKAFL